MGFCFFTLWNLNFSVAIFISLILIKLVVASFNRGAGQEDFKKWHPQLFPLPLQLPQSRPDIRARMRRSLTSLTAGSSLTSWKPKSMIQPQVCESTGGKQGELPICEGGGWSSGWCSVRTRFHGACRAGFKTLHLLFLQPNPTNQAIALLLLPPTLPGHPGHLSPIVCPLGSAADVCPPSSQESPGSGRSFIPRLCFASRLFRVCYKPTFAIPTSPTKASKLKRGWRWSSWECCEAPSSATRPIPPHFCARVFSC